MFSWSFYLYPYKSHYLEVDYIMMTIANPK